jgi:hypothetical protein
MANKWDEWFQSPIPGANGITPETILNVVEDPHEDIYRQLMPHSNMYEDKCGRPIYWELTGEISSRFGEVLKNLTCEDLVIRHIRQQEMMVKRLEYASKKHNTLIEKQVIVFNLANMSYSVDTNAISVFRQTLAIDEAFYPERLQCLYMVNAPWFFTATWAMIRPWLDPITANKIRILGSDFLEELRLEIADDQIPPQYGGSGKDFTWTWPFPSESGCAPEQLAGSGMSHEVLTTVPATVAEEEPLALAETTELTADVSSSETVSLPK